MQSIAAAFVPPTQETPPSDAAQRKANRVRWLKLNFTVKAARLQSLKRQKYQHLQEEALLKARGLLKNWENGVVVLTEDLYRLAAGEREAAELMNYTPEALALRFSLRNDPNVLEAVRQLWQIEMPRDAMGCIDQRGYASVFRRVAKSLDVKAFRRKQKVDRLLDEDWKRDSKGEATMSFANFFDSIFELADLWCETIDANDYVFFLERLRDRISHVRRGTRSLKLLEKVGAFDADSEDEEDEEEEEEEEVVDEEDSGEEAEIVPVAKPPPQAQAPRLPVAKSTKPNALEQLPKAPTLRKVSRLAISSTKSLPRRQLSTGGKPKPSVATPTTAVSATTTVAVPALIDAAPLTASSSMSDIVSPLLPPQSSFLPRGMQPRQRRASVVTTIQFGQDGYVRSRSESIGEDDETVSNIVQHQQNAVPTAIPHAVAAAFAANARRKGSYTSSLRPSLASAAAAVLASRNKSLSESPRQSPPSRSTDQVNHPVQEPANEPPATERKRVVTVSTAKYAVLKSIVFATRKAPGRPTREGPPSGDRDTSIDTPYPYDTPYEYQTQEQLQPWEPRETPEQVQQLNTVSNETSEPVDTYTGGSSGQSNERIQEPPQLTVPTTATTKPTRGAVSSTMPSAHAISSGVAIRLRSGSIFGIGNKNSTTKPMGSTTASSKGVRVGFGKTGAAALARRDRGVLTPLGVPPGGMGTFAGAVAKTPQTHQYALTAMPSHGPQGTTVAVVSGSLPSGDVDFSDSFVMTNYVMDRPPLAQSVQGLRTPIVLGAANGRKPASTTTPPTLASPLGNFQGPAVHGTSALAKPLMLQIEHPLPRSDTELPQRKPIVVVVNKPQPQPQQQPSPSSPPHRYLGHTLYGPSGRQSNGDMEGTAPSTHEGDPDLALRAKAVLDQNLVAVRGKEKLMHTVLIGNDRHFAHADQDAAPRDRAPTRSERHGMVIQSLHHRTATREISTKAVPRPNRFVDSFATPWDTFENEDDESSDLSAAASSPRSLLQPENAMETLTRVISKRTASRSAGSSHRDLHHGSFSPSPGSPVRRRSYAPEDSYFDSVFDEYGADDDSGIPTAHTRARLLTVSSLGGSSVESGLQTVPRRLFRRGSDEEYTVHSDELRESVSAPVLPTITPLELDYSRQQPPSLSPKQRTRTTSQPPSLIKLPIRGHVQGMEMAVDDLELRGELAMDPSRSPPRASAVTVQRPSPAKTCTCSRRRGPEETGESDSAESHSWPPPVYRLDRVDTDQEQEDGGAGSGSPGKCVACQRQRRDPDATIVLNATRELVLTPQSKEQHVAALIGRDTPSRSEMMRRRHRYTRGKPM